MSLSKLKEGEKLLLHFYAGCVGGSWSWKSRFGKIIMIDLDKEKHQIILDFQKKRVCVTVADFFYGEN